MSSTTFPGPVAPENNPPINPQYYAPRSYTISAISLGTTTLVTTSVDHDYVVGQLCRLLIPPTYGCTQLNNQSGYVVSVPADNQVRLQIVSTNGDAFIPSPTYGPTPPQILAVGDINSGVTNTGRSGNQTFISGSFINISPN